LFGPKGILAAFPARQSQKRNIGVQTPGEVGENCGGFIVRVRGDVQDARGDAGAVDRFDGFGKTGAGSGSGRKLSADASGEDRTDRQGEGEPHDGH
jgi:hypothetical protein